MAGTVISAVITELRVHCRALEGRRQSSPCTERTFTLGVRRRGGSAQILLGLHREGAHSAPLQLCGYFLSVVAAGLGLRVASV